MCNEIEDVTHCHEGSFNLAGLHAWLRVYARTVANPVFAHSKLCQSNWSCQTVVNEGDTWK